MFKDLTLQNALETSSSIKSNSLITAEWNMNDITNLSIIGNYRFRPTGTNSPITFYDALDSGNYYKDATDSDITIDGGYDEFGEPQSFLTKKQKEAQLFSLESCFEKFRPRSGINKLRYLSGRYLQNTTQDLPNRPRYYMADKDDLFKYWTSYRTETNSDGATVERGIAKNIINNQYYIDDACPFVVYKDYILANRLVIKMQTNVGTVDLGPFTEISGSLSDPFYGQQNKTTPVKWKIQILKNKNWLTVSSFDANSKRLDGSNIIKEDGHVELSYGLDVPDIYKEKFVLIDNIKSIEELPVINTEGNSYILRVANEVGKGYTWKNNRYETFTPEYKWHLVDENTRCTINFVTDLNQSENWTLTSTNNQIIGEHVDSIRGVRIVVETMNKFDSTFDLIEISPRLSADISEIVKDFDINKIASDLGTNGLPIGQLLASSGSITLFDNELFFNENNPFSMVYGQLSRNVKFVFYENVYVDSTSYTIPLKTMYSENIPSTDLNDRTTKINLRDMYFYLESISAPTLFLTDISITAAVSILLDSVGFSNYYFKRLSTESDIIIPFFFCNSDKTVAEVLNNLAVSAQCSMFFDEYNDFILMTRGYMLPSSADRPIDMTLYGSKNSESESLENIISFNSSENKIYNDGKINYTTRYIQRSYGSLKQATMIDQDKNWIYKPVLLWEVSGTQKTKPMNGSAESMSNYALGAMPLSSDLSNSLPKVVNGKLTNYTMDLGENVYWLSRYSGYFYSNGEVIKYDAAQFNVSKIGNVWITSTQQYEKYASELPFNGKIYPTGLVRIYCEPDYEEISGVTRLKNGDVLKHGRGYFNTTVTEHSAGIKSYWKNNSYVRGCTMDTDYIFGTKNIPAVETPVLSNNENAKQSVREGLIKNFMTNSYISEYDNSKMLSTQSGTIQSSALVFTGPTFKNTEKAENYISYIYKPLTDKFKHFGARLRIIGKIDNSEVRGQTPLGSMTYYVVPGNDPSQNISIGGGSGGVSVMVNPENGSGYYFEIAALSDTNVSKYNSDGPIANMFFYKIGTGSTSEGKAVPELLWKGLSNIVVDDGNFTGQYRMVSEQIQTVYDIAIEYLDIGSVRRFYLYINNVVVASIDDLSPLKNYNTMAPFIRGTSKVMFENIFALGPNYSIDTTSQIDLPINSLFNNQETTSSDAFRKYSMSGIVQSSYLSGVSPSETPKYNLYFEEFGSIMRECEYFNIKYDKAFPALYAKLSPTFNKIKGYVVSGFSANAYGAEFLIFNATDTTLNLDETSGNYLRIQGITFTQDTTKSLTVDDYYSQITDTSNPIYNIDGSVKNSTTITDQYNKIKKSRSKYGRSEFTLELPYVQKFDDAKDTMSWIIKKIAKPRKSIGLNIFAMPTLQLGDIVNLYYKNENAEDVITSENTKFVIYNINYSKDSRGPSMKVYLSEVTDA
jgi:hypothetical protein